jgi:hypothetical protein
VAWHLESGNFIFKLQTKNNSCEKYDESSLLMELTQHPGLLAKLIHQKAKS